MEKKDISIEGLKQEYEKVKHDFNKFRSELCNQLENLVIQNDLTLGFPIESRIKTWNSIEEKIERKSYKFQSIMEMQDLIGIRLIFLFRPDVEKMHQVINNSFDVINDEDTFGRLESDQFGYSSIHLVIKFQDDWLVVPSLTKYGGLHAEIQVRTVAQHLWASVSHKLQYKKETSVPEPILRSIYRVSALLETVDLEFNRVLEERESYRDELDIDEIDTILNRDSLELVMDSILPQVNKSEYEPYDELLSQLIRNEIDSTQKVQKLLTKHKEKILEIDLEEVNERKETLLFFEDSDQIRVLEKGVYYSHAGLVRHALREEFGSDW